MLEYSSKKKKKKKGKKTEKSKLGTDNTLTSSRHLANTPLMTSLHLHDTPIAREVTVSLYK